MRLFNHVENNKFVLNESMNRAAFVEAVKIYWDFIFKALSGLNPDSYYIQNSKKINFIASLLRDKFPKEIKPLYRGILLFPNEVHDNKVKHQREITYVSFSEDKNVAVAFADTQNSISSFVAQLYPTKKGYLITKNTYNQNLMLFHYEWLFDAMAIVAFRKQFGNDSKFVEIQKEVILKPENSYEVEPVIPGSSNNMEVGKE
jgi:hypothetical protein